MLKTDFVVHHIGGRNGGGAFDTRTAFHRDMVNVLFDADADCAEKTSDVVSKFGYRSVVLPYCLGPDRQPRVLNLNYDLHTSSNLKANPAYSEWYMFHHSFDYILGDTFRTVEERVLDCVALDDLRDSDEVWAHPDFLTIDTQGTEHDILTGAGKVLGHSVIGVACEVEFAPLYEGQALFGDILSLLHRHGFHFVEFTRLGTMAPRRYPVGQRGKGMCTYGDGLFLRRIDSLAALPLTEGERLIQAHKLAFAALCFGQVEYALAVLDFASDIAAPAETRQAVDATSYGRMLGEVRQAARALPSRLPPRYCDLYTLDQSRMRHQLGLPADAGQLKRWLHAHPKLLTGLRWMRYKVWALRKLVRDGLHYAAACRRTGLEAALVRYGLADVAEIVRQKRKVQSPYAK